MSRVVRLFFATTLLHGLTLVLIALWVPEFWQSLVLALVTSAAFYLRAPLTAARIEPVLHEITATATALLIEKDLEIARLRAQS